MGKITTVHLDDDSYAAAKRAGLNLSATLREAIRNKVVISEADIRKRLAEAETKADNLRHALRVRGDKIRRAREWFELRIKNTDMDLIDIAEKTIDVGRDFGLTGAEWIDLADKVKRSS